MKRWLKFVILFILFIVGVFLYAKYIGTMGFITKEYTIYDDNLPTSFDGLKVVHFSDLHYNRAINEDKVTDIINEINLLNPDVVVFTGDLIDKDVIINDDDYEFLTKLFSNINVKYGKYAILGNHDYYNKEKIIKLFNDSNFKYLENEYDVVISKNNENIYIAGIGNLTHNLDVIDKALKDIKDDDLSYKVVLVHEPDISDDIINNYEVDLILGGHSHNGQVRLPVIGALYTPLGAKKYYDEYYKVNNTDIYISSGIGVSNVNVRLFNKPSINFYRINKRWIFN